MPQTGPDLVGAGYPISRPLSALLGGTTNATQPNVPVKTNLDFGLGGLVDAVAAGNASVNVVAVPALPGDVFTKLSIINGVTPGSPTAAFGLLFTGTGSAPGTAGAQPTLIASSASTAACATGNMAYTFTFSSPVTITSAQAPFGYIYAGWSWNIATGSPTWVGMTAACAAQNPWFSTSPYTLYGTSASTASFATLGTTTRAPNPPVVLLY